MKLLFLLLLVSLIESRPLRRKQAEGEIRNYGNQKKFTYDNTGLKRSSRNSPMIKYDIELVDEFHSLDEFMDIDKVECQEDDLIIYTCTTTIENWNIDDIIFGSDMWGCGENIYRKMTSLTMIEKRIFNDNLSYDNRKN